MSQKQQENKMNANSQFAATNVPLRGYSHHPNDTKLYLS
jgi:hypothetical protein